MNDENESAMEDLGEELKMLDMENSATHSWDRRKQKPDGKQ